MPDEKHENNLYYAGVSAGAPKEASVVLTKDQLKSILKEGSNVLSVELHQDRESSSDIYFEFQNLSLNYNENNTDGDNSGSNDEKVTQKSIFLTENRTRLDQHHCVYLGHRRPAASGYRYCG